MLISISALFAVMFFLTLFCAPRADVVGVRWLLRYCVVGAIAFGFAALLI